MKNTMVNLAHQDVNGAQVEELVGHNSRYICITEVGCLWTAVHERAQFLPRQNFPTRAKMGKMYQCVGIMFKNNDTLNRMNYTEIVLASSFIT
jgi:hypothetical protein